MAEHKTEARWHHLAGGVALLALFVLSLLLVAWGHPTPGLAAPPSGAVQAGRSGDLAVPTLVTYTAYLPFISRPAEVKSNVWYAEYYNNEHLSGEPVRTAEEVRVDYDWEEDGPSGLPKDHFSARWTGYWDFEYGEYTFFVDADDGVRLWLDGKLIIDVWQASRISERARVVVKQAGPHQLKLEYFERTQLASVRIHWRRTDLYPRWFGEYYRLPWAETAKWYEQMDDAIQFEWEDGCPENLPCDGFSIVWTAEPVFLSGHNRIYLYADDGYQLFMDGNNVQEGGWFDGQEGGGVDDYYKMDFSQIEEHKITFKFQDRGGLAEARLWIQNMEYPFWKVEYYSNRNLAGAPSATDEDPVVFHDWKWDKPHKSVYSDDFSVRWSGQRFFNAGCYRFGLFADDGVRLWVDGELLVDEWHDGRDEYYAPATYLSAGNHEVIIEYYEHDNEAEIRFWW